MDLDTLVGLIDAQVRAGKTIDEACRELYKVAIPRDDILKARARFEQRIGLIQSLTWPTSFVDRARIQNWYPGPSESDRYWPALRNLLSQGRPGDVVASIDQSSTRVVSLLPPPGLQRFNSRGLVIGYIQSGKTANFAAVIAKAADVGYKFFIVMSGVHNPLRAQTQTRLERELVDLNRDRWFALTSRDDDFRPQGVGNAGAFLTDVHQQRVLCVVKKNATVLRRLRNWLQSAGEDVLRGCPVLVIDDEADVASPNASGNADRRTVINRLLLEILEALPRVAYVGYTATPFANIFVDPTFETDLYPRDFIVDLPRPSGYFGPERIFGRDPVSQDESGAELEGLDMIRHVPDTDVPLLRPGGPKARATFRAELTPSLREALLYFWLASAARVARGHGDRHSSMLIHTSMYVDVHYQFEVLVEAFREATAVHLDRADPELLPELRELWSRETARVPAGELGETPTTFDELFPHLLDTVRRSFVVVENGLSARRLEYGEQGEAQIVIGGNTLSRGLTLEGLVVSYFVRSATAYDTLLQMGRWFGYRPGYADLARIWMTEELEVWFHDLATVEQEIRSDIARYEMENLTPLDFGIRVRQHPQMSITARLKMQAAVECDLSYSNSAPQTILFQHRDRDWLERNLAAGRQLITEIRAEGIEPRQRDGRVLFRGVPCARVLSFLGRYAFHPNSVQLREDLLTGYIDAQNREGDLLIWDVAVIGRKPAPGVRTISLGPGVDEIPLIERSRMPVPTEYANLKAIMSSQDREIVGDFGENGATDGVTVARGLLLLYPIAADSRPARDNSNRAPLGALEDLLGVAFVFPEARNPTPQRYLTVDLSGVAREEPEWDDEDVADDEGQRDPA